MHHKSERYSVTLVPPSIDAIDRLMEMTGLSKTDCINRATMILAFLDKENREGKDMVIRTPDGSIEKIHFI
ncbi:hypothetical protein [Rhodococcus qingshengii]|uniref:hypothetical protein n=1 Tax=Rhodococcus qingshengii TaxID=334542 RepID=UPI0035D6E4B1